MNDTPGSEGEGRWEEQIRSETLGHGARVRPVPKRSPSKIQEAGRDPAVFAKNLSSLIQHACLPEAEAPARIGVRRRWLRRVMCFGLSRIDRRSRPDLERVAHYFSLSKPEELWDPDLHRLRRQPAIDQQVLGWRERVNWTYAKKLLELLEAGEHEFLKGLIDSLHASELLRARTGEGEQHVVRPEPDHSPGLKRRFGRTKPPE